LYGNFSDLYADYLTYCEEKNIIKRNLKTFMKHVKKYKIKKLSIFECSFLCPICLKGSVAVHELRKLLNNNENNIENKKLIEKFTKLENEKAIHLELVKIQKNCLNHQQLKLKEKEMIIYMDFTTYNFAIIDFILIIEKKGKKYEMFHFLCQKDEEVKSDNSYVRYCINLLREKYNIFNENEMINFWSDGCKGQFKNRFTLYYFSILKEKFPNITFISNFFGSNHGHNNCDSEAAVIKKIIRKNEKINCEKIIKAKQLIEILKNYNWKKKNRNFFIVDIGIEKY